VACKVIPVWLAITPAELRERLKCNANADSQAGTRGVRGWCRGDWRNGGRPIL